MKARTRLRRVVMVLLATGLAVVMVLLQEGNYQTVPVQPVAATADSTDTSAPASEAILALAKLEVKGRAPSTGYKRALFGDGWSRVGGCDTRNIILARDMEDEVVNDECKVLSGVLHDPYTGHEITFVRGADTSDKVQIDHVVALSDAWQKGAQQLSAAERVALANDPLELLAVDGAANQQKSNGDAATWLPSNKAFRCQYVARQIAVKAKYRLWVTAGERDAMQRILSGCPQQTLPSGT